MDTPEAVTTPVVTEVASAGLEMPQTPWYRKRPLVIALAAALLIFVAAGYYLYSNTYKQGGIVATVDGQPIYRAEYEENLRLLQESAAGQGINIEDEAFKAEAQTQALDNMINNMVLIRAAHESNIVVEDADINEVHAQLVASVGSEEALATRMSEIGLSEEKLRTNIEERILVDKYIESVSDVESITVSDEEIQAFLEQNLPQGAEASEMPPIEELRPAVEAQIKSMKQQQMVQAIIEGLRGEAKVDVRI